MTKLQEMKGKVADHELEETFNQVKEKLLSDYKNFYYEQSYQQAFALFENMMVNASLEYKQARKLLETFTYEDFKESTDKWMKSGRQCWFVCGNYDSEEAK